MNPGSIRGIDLTCLNLSMLEVSTARYAYVWLVTQIGLGSVSPFSGLSPRESSCRSIHSTMTQHIRAEFALVRAQTVLMQASICPQA